MKECEQKFKVNIIGAGLAGVSAAITLARNNISCNLVSMLPSERSQSVLAEGGINGALNTMGEEDSYENHFADTMKAGCYIADEKAVMGLVRNAPDILLELQQLGVPFNLQKERIQLRNFGGQKKKRTAYARSSTGKVLMTALIDEARKYEAAGLITRYHRHELIHLVIQTGDVLLAEQKSSNHLHSETQTSELQVQFPGSFPSDFKQAGQEYQCEGVVIRDTYTNQEIRLNGPTILAYGGMNGLFPGETTGTVTNSGDAAALCLASGVRFSNLEMIQYHPTTIKIAGKRMLVSEAARGEGGRLFVLRDGKPWYFMEELHPELGNLSPRDVVAREMYFVARGLTSQNAEESFPSSNSENLHGANDSKESIRQIYLDMRHLSKEIWDKKLPDLRQEIRHYLGIDPAKEPVPVEPGIHYFMGGIDVDVRHRTNIDWLYAAGECCSQYHGANRLGGNSTMGAIYGGRVAAMDIRERLTREETDKWKNSISILPYANAEDGKKSAVTTGNKLCLPTLDGTQEMVHSTLSGVPEMVQNFPFIDSLGHVLRNALGIVRNETQMQQALAQVDDLWKEFEESGDICKERARLILAKAMLVSAILRRESRGAHYRSDFPHTDDAFNGMTTCEMLPGSDQLQFDLRRVNI